ncbi:hypothetical protein A1Q1_03624 [Trichosporon asahii var. asahii CBS 2479]|uniref:Uncharacterized protein n=1 Tax=Trichosporon asahii var. asahii (strain ATCC 90039 / CBS 2479 / JCM 2466 / KCTC 7840 / NBRC 103889/ NCYC 2677 / UAMH 7654) TaxID=1186058 RepID=J6EXH8_TRIAS|nr:hypothetical protein A1Q1_03624 [Trichosporon asahii var. asahii CBS 2479]EJT47512.1 hypothetical protein A1Q1_03624 [Trichosporon asahii var. asahii CBS 2479]
MSFSSTSTTSSRLAPIPSVGDAELSRSSSLQLINGKEWRKRFGVCDYFPCIVKRTALQHVQRHEDPRSPTIILDRQAREDPRACITDPSPTSDPGEPRALLRSDVRSIRLSDRYVLAAHHTLTAVQEEGPPTPPPEPDCPPVVDRARPPAPVPANLRPHSDSQRGPPTRLAPQRTRSRSATLPSRHIEEMHELAGELDELPTYAECARDRPPPIGPPVHVVHLQAPHGVHVANGVQVRSGRSQSLGAAVAGWAGPDRSPRDGWVRDSDGQWRQGRRRAVPVPASNPAHPSNYPLSPRSQARTQTSRSLPSRLGLEPRPHPPHSGQHTQNQSQREQGQRPGHGQILLRPRSRQNNEPAGNGKVWRKKLGVWYVARKEGFFVETVGPQGERWRRTLGVWHVVSET